MRRALILLVLLVPKLGMAAEPAETADGKASNAKTSKPKESLPWMQYLDATLGDYVIVSKGNPKQRFARTDQPVLVHTDNIGGEEKGLLYIWKDSQGRPAAAITGILMRWEKGESTWEELHEFHSLWKEPIRMQVGNAGVWQPEQAGVKWNKFDVGFEPAKSERMRELQVKKIARRFKGKINYRERGAWNLRIMPKPIYKYEIKQQKAQPAVAGNIFAFCRSTDPEILLLLESRTDKAGKTEWYWASVCFAGDSSFLSLDGKEVWSDDPPQFGSNYKHASRFNDRGFNYLAKLKVIQERMVDKEK